MALFQDQVSQITQLCDTFLQPFSQKPVMRHLGLNIVFFNNVPRYEIIESQDVTRNVQTNCSTCIHTVPCGVKIQTDSLIILIPRCPSLTDKEQFTTVSHVLNLQAIAPLLDPKLLEEFSAETTFFNPVNISLPAINVFQPQNQQKLSDAFRTLDTQSIHLTAAINQSLAKGLIFQSSADHIVYKISEQGFANRITASWESFKSWFSNPFQIITKLLTMLQTIAIIYLFYRIHVIAGALSLLQAGVHAFREVEENTVKRLEEFFRQQNESPTGKPPLINYVPQVSEDFHVMQTLIFLLLAGIILYAVGKRIQHFRNQHTFQIILEISNRESEIKLPIMKLSHSSDMYNFNASAFLQNLEIQGIIQPKMKIRWPSFTIEHKLLAKRLQLPTTISINFHQACQARQIMASYFEILLFTKEWHSETLRIMPLQNSTWSQIQQNRSETHIAHTQSWKELLGYPHNPPEYI